MRTFAALFFLLAATSCAEDDIWLEPPDGFQWPSFAGNAGDWQTVPLQDLAPSIRNLVGDDDLWTSTTDPKSIRIQWIDLNDDGLPELFIENLFGGSGGPAFTIFKRVGNEFREIGGLQGGMRLAEKHQGWFQLDCSSRSGGGVLVRYLLRFNGETYNVVRSESHDLINNRIEINPITE